MAKRKRAKKVKRKRSRRAPRKLVEPAREQKSRFAPLNTAFLVTSIIGFFISTIYITKFSLSWAFAFGFLFFVMFIAAMISMARATPDGQLLPRPR